MHLRDYQRRLCDEAKGKNTIVLLPTGAGKTIVGAQIILEKLVEEGDAGNCVAVFLVPTRFLVTQQVAALRGWFTTQKGQFRVVGHHGDLSLPAVSDWDVLVSTPQAFRSIKQRILDWDRVCLLVFDEVHHVLKDHPYRKLALDLQQHHQRGGSMVQVVGLTALLTYAVTPAKVEKAKKQLCQELAIQKMPHVSREQLRLDGFHAGAAVETEVRDAIVVPSIFEPHQCVPEAERKPHCMHQTFFDRIKSGAATIFAKELLGIIRKVESLCCVSLLQSPLSRPKLASWGEQAHERVAQCTSPSPWLLYLEHLYEALRITVQYWEEPKGCELAVLFLKMMKTKTELNLRKTKLDQRCEEHRDTLQSVECFMEKYGSSLPLLNHVVEELLRQKQKRPELRAVVFVQQKTTAHVLSYHLNRDSGLCASDLRSVPLHSTTTAPPTRSITFTKADENRNLKMFALGEVQILVTTSVAEEGMDVGAANCVIRVDPPLTGVSFVQGMGRARQANSAHVVVAQRSDRPVEALQAVVQLQAQIAREFKPIVKSAADREQDRISQRSREKGALAFLQKEAPLQAAVGMLNLFCRKTKVTMGETAHQGMLELVYESCVRKVAVKEIASGNTKASRKQAKQKAAAAMVERLFQECR